MRFLFLFCFVLTFLPLLHGQNSGEGAYSFLLLNNSAKTAAMGGIQVALPDPEPELLLQNPALLSPEMNNRISVSYARYLAGIGFGYGSFARDLGKWGTAAVGIQFVNYGQFIAADETGQITGSFSASDYALTLVYARSFGKFFTAGISLKPVYSHLENYQSTGIAADAGISHRSADGLTNFALCIRNLGTQLTSYYGGGSREAIAWSLAAGLTKQLQYAPVRLSITAYDLNHWNKAISATDPNSINVGAIKLSPFEIMLRHLSLGAELFPRNRITLRAGYNYRRRQELAVSDQMGFTGLTAGFGINLSTISFNYAISGYAHAGLVHNFSMSANIHSFAGRANPE